MATLCLCMIVKDESRVIERAISSVRPFIDSWVVVDTGSADDTRELVRQALAGIPGELVDRPWVSFGHNRSEALSLARGRSDYILILDADDVFTAPAGWTVTGDLDSYQVKIVTSGVSYLQTRILRSSLPWQYKGAVHEVPVCESATTHRVVEGICIHSLCDGASWSDPDKYLKHARLLESELALDPLNTRTMFYLAQSYRDAGLRDQATRAYERRVEAGGWVQEIYVSLLRLACLVTDPAVAACHLLRAYSVLPERAEALYNLCRLFRGQGWYATAYLFGMKAFGMSPPQGALFLEEAAYGAPLCDELSICTFYLGRYQESAPFAKKALDWPWPLEERVRISTNLACAETCLPGDGQVIRCYPTEKHNA